MQNVPFNDYRAMSGLNASLLKACANGLYHGYRALHVATEPSDAMRFGTALHAYFLEFDRFNDLVAVRPNVDRRTKAGKEIAEAFEASAGAKTIISQDDLDLIKRMRLKTMSLNDYTAVEVDGLKEYTIQGMAQFAEIKGRLDLVAKDGSVIVDVKTTKSADPSQFARDFVNLHYDIQFLHYANLARLEWPDLRDVPRMLVLACETTSGEVALYDVTEIATRDRAVEKYWRAVDTFYQLEKTTEQPDKFPQYAVKLETPAWA